MLKAILANRTRIAADYPTQEELAKYCDEELDEYDIIIQTLEKDKRYCLTTRVFFLIGSEGAKIAYINEDGSLSKQTNNAIGAASPYDLLKEEVLERTYQIVVPKTQRVHIFELGFVTFKTKGYKEYENYSYEYETRCYISLKKNYEGKMSTYIKYSNSKLTIKNMYLDVINPNGATISAKNEENTIVGFDPEEHKSRVTIENRTTIYVYPKGFSYNEKPKTDGVWSAKAKITIKGNEGIKLPEKFFELTPDTIYTTSTPDASLTDKEKLSKGAIVGIVIAIVAAIVIVCGFAGFGVYWFIFRDKASFKEFSDVLVPK